MRRFALYSDIHGNIVALDAVLADIEKSGIAERYCLGDLVGYGPEPSAVIERVRSTGDPVVRGNYDDGVGKRTGGCGCYYGTAEARVDGEASYAWTDAALDAAEHDYLAGLPDELRFEVEGVRVLLVHASPRRINEYLMLDRPDSNLAKLAGEGGADLVCFGHVHIPYHRSVTMDDHRAAHFVSDGSVGKPKDGDSRACWIEVVIGSAEDVAAHAPSDEAPGPVGDRRIAAVFHRVAYDVDAVARAVVASGLPPRLADALRNS